jgi:hypothetical protein
LIEQLADETATFSALVLFGFNWTGGKLPSVQPRGWEGGMRAIFAASFLGVALLFTASPAPTQYIINVPASTPNAPAGPAIRHAPTPTAETQQRFLLAIERARDEYRSAANDMAKGATRHNRARALCAALGRRYTIDGWTGTISTLSSNSNGLGVLGIELAQDVHIQTWNNAFSDVIDKTLINPASYLFQSASRMRIGDKVRFSGNLFASEVDCVKEASVTLHGSLTAPAFIMRFQAVSPDQ